MNMCSPECYSSSPFEQHLLFTEKRTSKAMCLFEQNVFRTDRRGLDAPELAVYIVLDGR